MLSSAINTALYPPRLACEERASIFCALEIRGTASMLNAEIPALTQASISAGLVTAHINEISTAPFFIFEISSGEGALTLRRTSEPEYIAEAFVILAPAATYISSL